MPTEITTRLKRKEGKEGEREENVIACGQAKDEILKKWK